MQSKDSNWQHLSPRKRMEYLLKTGHLSDCSFILLNDGGKKIILKCHKFVLMSVSPVFERMFEGDFEESKLPDNIKLDDVFAKEFRKFINYLYWHDNRRLDTYDLETLHTLIYLSKKYMITFFTNNCRDAIKRRLYSGLEADVTIDLYECAHQLDEEELITIIQSQFRLSPERYINAAGIFDLSSEIFLKFIEEFSFVEEKVRFSVIERYINQSINNTINEIKTVKPSKPMTINQDIPDGDKSEKDKKNNLNKNDIENAMEKNNEPNAEQTTKMENDKEQNIAREMQTKEEYIANLLKTIKFTSMTAYDFCAGPGVSNLLTIEKKYEILSSLCIAEYKKLTLRTI